TTCLSPAVNTGDDDAITELNDLTGKERIQGSQIDLGAYESIPCESVEMETLELDLCSDPLFVDFEELEGAIAYIAEITVEARNGEVIRRRILPPPFTAKVKIPRRLIGTTAELRLAAIFMDEVNSEERINDFSEPISITIECSDDIEGRSAFMAENSVITLSPNPVQEVVNLTFVSEVSENVEIQVVTVSGKVLKSQTMRSVAGENQFNMKVEELPSGMYFIHILTEKKAEILQLIKE
ncbi:MAG: T9SS type A sorting domain-containing protein, partial [Bacteroidota bacterium]